LQWRYASTMGKGFQRTIEDFTCGHCGAHVVGDGYTNHCPKCLWSKHVDVNPGDRAAQCGGLMKPIAVEGSSPHYSLVQRCELCGHTKRNAADPSDDTAVLLAIAAK
ncbi:MAG: RNHCP domain-containing protein, partial [Patescibacteria group bacterium]|nr:RNHCP domain-containing protein [Patescibacteria group bacterium]